MDMMPLQEQDFGECRLSDRSVIFVTLRNSFTFPICPPASFVHCPHRSLAQSLTALAPLALPVTLPDPLVGGPRPHRQPPLCYSPSTSVSPLPLPLDVVGLFHHPSSSHSLYAPLKNLIFFPPVTSFYAVEARGRSIYVRRWIHPSPAPTSTPTEGEEDSAQLPPLPDPQAQHDVAGARALEEAESELLLVVEAPGGGAGGGGHRRVLGRAAHAVSPRRAQGATSGEQFRGGGVGLQGLQGVPVPLLQVLKNGVEVKLKRNALSVLEAPATSGYWARR
ncbi:uncharacterized protein [Triticum aestivum]|uniref:uncharacterized protein n=1 Tax=Triticum aestivum TaxID=4565 RepID=UPI001D027EDD|nr:uncharacterized protein LOC123142809 [Triticum aestivum]